jgi:hypothetical protein
MMPSQKGIVRTDEKPHLEIGRIGSIFSRNLEWLVKADWQSTQSDFDCCGSCESECPPGRAARLSRRVARRLTHQETSIFERNCALSPFIADLALAISFAWICAI